MKQPSSPDLELATARLLGDRLLDVPITRARGSARLRLATLLRAACAHPVFAGWPTPVDGWLDEAALLADEVADADARGRVLLRRAVVRMRRLDLDAALDLVQQANAAADASAGELAACCAISRVRVLVRQQRLDDACQALQAIPLAPPGDSASALRQLALGEYHIEANEVAGARAALTQALARLPEELVEERIQASQSLAFVFISLVDLPRALRHLQQARAMLRGAAVWREVIQMDVALASLLAARGEHAAAQALLAEAAELCQAHPQAGTRHPDRSRHGQVERRAAAGRRRRRRLPAGGERLCRTGEPARTGEHGGVHGRHPDRRPCLPRSVPDAGHRSGDRPAPPLAGGRGGVSCAHRSPAQ
jgi:tetratricopeptide (TPR) repeat protein